MPQNIGKRRGTSAIQARLEQERKAARLDPAGKKSFVDKTAMLAELASYGVPIATAANLSAKAAAKLAKNIKYISLYRREPPFNYSQVKRSFQKAKQNPNKENLQYTGRWFHTDKNWMLGDQYGDVLKKVKVSRNEFNKIKNIKGIRASDKVNPTILEQIKDVVSPYYKGTVPKEIRRRANVIPRAAGGVVKKRATSKRVKVTRGDGIAKRGKTRGRMV